MDLLLRNYIFITNDDWSPIIWRSLKQTTQGLTKKYRRTMNSTMIKNNTPLLQLEYWHTEIDLLIQLRVHCYLGVSYELISPQDWWLVGKLIISRVLNWRFSDKCEKRRKFPILNSFLVVPRHNSKNHYLRLIWHFYVRLNSG